MLSLFSKKRTDKISKKKVSDEPSLCLDLDGREVVILLRRHPRAKRYSLRLPQGSASPVLTLPANGTLRTAEDFARKNTGWLAERLENRADHVPFVDGALIPFRGTEHRILSAPGKRGTVKQVNDLEEPILLVYGDPAHLTRRLTDWLKKQARADILKAVDFHTENLGRRHSSISIRDTKSRWGSCSSSGKLSFSWRLVLAPPDILDYVAAHEVAHLAEMNHSARFWAHTRRLCPHTDVSKKWLRDHGNALHGYG
ncbi:MAG: SprT family zinc-dependent metalloprotease [Stappiaceae bacterium]